MDINNDRKFDKILRKGRTFPIKIGPHYELKCNSCGWSDFYPVDMLRKKFSLMRFLSFDNPPKKCPKCGSRVTMGKVVIFN